MIVTDLYQLSPLLAEAEQRAEALKARAISERARWQELHDQRLKGRTDEERAKMAERVLAGDEIHDDEAEIRKARETTFAFEAAAEQAAKVLPALRREAGRELTKRLKGDHDRLQKKLFGSLVEAKAVWDELHALRRAIENQGVGVNELFQVDARSLMGAPTDPSSELNYLLREAQKLGYCKKVN